jgi:hypothetical protein
LTKTSDGFSQASPGLVMESQTQDRRASVTREHGNPRCTHS